VTGDNPRAYYGPINAIGENLAKVWEIKRRVIVTTGLDFSKRTVALWHSAPSVAKALNRSTGAVSQKALRLGVRFRSRNY
jgi:hypothetical protein